ncbi:SRPBCC family protein [soil metagenome]
MTVTRDITATRERVWAVLADGWSYSGWVVGNSRIRAVSANWPAPGSKILHSIGTWPAVIDDETEVISATTGYELVLLAKVRAAAQARITVRLSELSAGGCRVEMTEVAVSRPLRWVPDAVQLLGVAPRNRECTWRLAMIAENRTPSALD